MAHSKLHIICGNCGSNDEFQHEIITNVDPEIWGEGYHAVYLSCNNCGTLHNLTDYSEFKSK